jgi:hypothetical protein
VAPDRADERRHTGAIDLSAEVADVDIDQVRQGITIGFPHVFGEMNTAHDFPSAAHQGLENRVLLRGQADEDAASYDFVARGVERQVLDGEQDRPG